MDDHEDARVLYVLTYKKGLNFYCYPTKKMIKTLQKNKRPPLKTLMNCPCKSKKKYEDCCKPYHDGKIPPPNALILMRSRYSAYALALAEYIIETTHPDHPEVNKKNWDWREDILKFSRETEFIDLDILNFEENQQVAYVTFTASLKQNNKDISFTEKSLFEKIEGIWLYKQAEFL